MRMEAPTIRYLDPVTTCRSRYRVWYRRRRRALEATVPVSDRAAQTDPSTSGLVAAARAWTKMIFWRRSMSPSRSRMLTSVISSARLRSALPRQVEQRKRMGVEQARRPHRRLSAALPGSKRSDTAPRPRSRSDASGSSALRAVVGTLTSS
jgi:hypothetical protein